MANPVNDLVLKNVNTKLVGMLDKEINALPKGFNTLRFKQNVMTVLSDNDISNMKGQEFNLARCIMKGAYLGLDFMNKECYVITYGGKPQFMTDYKGEEKLAKKYSVTPIKDIYAKVVREGDFFEEGIEKGQQFINFRPKPFNTSEILGAFAIVYYRDGSMAYEVMSKEEIESIRDNFSKKSKKTGMFSDAWEKSFGEMAKKTVLRRLCKHIELDFDSIEQKKAWDETSDMEFEESKKVDDRPVDKSKMEKELEESGVIENEYIDTPFEEVIIDDNNQG